MPASHVLARGPLDLQQTHCSAATHGSRSEIAFLLRDSKKQHHIDAGLLLGPYQSRGNFTAISVIEMAGVLPQEFGNAVETFRISTRACEEQTDRDGGHNFGHTTREPPDPHVLD
jgi:hypothetical protein